MNTFIQKIKNITCVLKTGLHHLCVATLSCLSLFSYASDVKIGLLTNVSLISVSVMPATGSYQVFSNGVKVCDLGENEALFAWVENNAVSLKTTERTLGSFQKIKFVSRTDQGTFRMKAITPATDTYTYYSNLELSAHHNTLKAVNVVDIENYIEGVIEAEVGKANLPEFLKVQAIICRTYALSHLHRHTSEGFHLCDQVHCQVYRGKPRFNFCTGEAAHATKGLVIVDKNLQLITAAFHSNCGGQTSNSEDVWSKSLPYLKSVRDTFCQSQPHAWWEETVAVDDWLNYLSAKNRSLSGKKDSLKGSLSFFPDKRQTYFACQGINIPFKTIRSDWRLKSAYFCMVESQDSIIIRGKGYGHGVGMCQEGAMRMAELGMHYGEIIKFYYRDVGILTLDALRFLLED